MLSNDLQFSLAHNELLFPLFFLLTSTVVPLIQGGHFQDPQWIPEIMDTYIPIMYTTFFPLYMHTYDDI